MKVITTVHSYLQRVQHQWQLSASVRMGQAGGTVTQEKKKKKEAFSGVLRLVCLERLQKMHALEVDSHG